MRTLVTTVMATASTMKTAMVYATSSKWQVAKTKSPATTMLTPRTKTVLARMPMKATTAMATALLTQTATVYAIHSKLQVVKTTPRATTMRTPRTKTVLVRMRTPVTTVTGFA